MTLPVARHTRGANGKDRRHGRRRRREKCPWYPAVGWRPVLKNGQGPHINNIALGKWGRNRTNLWTYAGVNTFRKGRTEDLTDHPTVKPVDLVADAILDCSNIGGLVLDPFAGSGTTILACERTGMRAAAIEIDPYYVDVATAAPTRMPLSS